MNIPLLAEITGLHGAPGYEDNVRVWLKEKLKSEIHAVKIKTMTKEQALKHTL